MPPVRGKIALYSLTRSKQRNWFSPLGVITRLDYGEKIFAPPPAAPQAEHRSDIRSSGQLAGRINIDWIPSASKSYVEALKSQVKTEEV